MPQSKNASSPWQVFAAAMTAWGILCPLAPLASAQLVHLGKWEGSVEGRLDMARVETESGASTTTVDDGLLGESLTLRHAGLSVYNPRLLNLSLGGTFGLSQERLSQETGTSKREGTLGSYDVFAGVLSSQPTSLQLFAGRNENDFLRELAGRSESLTEHRGLTLFARRFPIPSSLTIRREHSKESSRSGSFTTRREDHRNILTYDGQRGWLNSDMGFRYESVEDIDDITPSLSFQSHEASMRYGRDMGVELNRHWDSRIRFFTRDGTSDLTTWTVDDSLRVEHTDDLSSALRYFLAQQETGDSSSTAHTASAELKHQWYDNLATTVGSDAQVNIVPGGRKHLYRGRLDWAYTRGLPSYGRLNAGLGTTVEYEDDQFAEGSSFIPQESHTIADLALPIILANPFVVESSVVVTKTSLGPLPTGCLPSASPPLTLVLGRDYTLRSIGGELLQIVPVTCSGTTPGINPGDTLAVDYQYDVSNALTFLTGGWHADVNLDYDWIRLYVNHSQQNQRLLDGEEDQFLEDRISDIVGTELRMDGSRTQASISGEAGRVTSDRLDYNQLQSRQLISLSARPNLTITAQADEAFLDFLDEEHKTLTTTQRVILTYIPTGRLSLEGLLGGRQLRDSFFATERTLESTLKLLWYFRNAEIRSTLGMFRRSREDTTTNELRANFRFVRRF